MWWILATLDGCRSDGEPERPARRPDRDDSTLGTDSASDASTPTTVVTHPDVFLFTADTVNRRFLGVNQATWDTTPAFDAFLADATFLPDVLSVRGLTPVSMASFLTGVYPRTHGVRSSDELPDGRFPALAERFRAAGYATWGFLGNQCEYGEAGFEVLVCTAVNGKHAGTNQGEGDRVLVDHFLDALATADDRPVFAWVHLMDPHDPYTLTSPWYEAFHPDPYEGDRLGGLDFAAISTGERAYTDEERAWLEAVYASQIRATDGNLEALLDGVRAAGRYADAVVVAGTDHGEELAAHNLYFNHDCSPYGPVVGVSWAVKAPGARGGAARVDGWVSTVDLAPTLVELAGLSWDGAGEGVSWVPSLASGVAPDRPVYFERSPETAGVIDGRWKYFRSPEGGYDDCRPYDESDATFVNAMEELYDLSVDPDETVNLLATGDHAERDRLRDTLCAWVTGSPWSTDDGTNPLVSGCRD